MNIKKENKEKNSKWIISYLKNVVSWSIFTILILIGAFLLYYFVAVRLYAVKGDKYEPRYSIYTIASGSMTPTLNVYDVIINTKVDNINDVKIRDVITFVSTWDINSGMTVTHRVIGIKKLDNGETCLITRGDYNTGEDPSCVKKENLIGVTRAVIPKLGRIQAFLANQASWLLIIVLPLLYMLIKYVLKLVRLATDKEIVKEKPKKFNKKHVFEDNDYYDDEE